MRRTSGVTPATHGESRGQHPNRSRSYRQGRAASFHSSGVEDQGAPHRRAHR